MCVWHIRIVPPNAAADILAAALAGDVEAQRLLAACGNVHRCINVVTEPSPATSSCMICDTPFWRGHAPEVIVLVSQYGNVTTPRQAYSASAVLASPRTTPLEPSRMPSLSAAAHVSVNPLRQLPPPVATAGHA
jgi:hypothetical protein